MSRFKALGLAAAFAASIGAAAAQEPPRSLVDAVRVALDTNPEILQATANREAVGHERAQARALYGPSLDFEASAGFRQLDNPSREAAGLGDETLEPVEASLLAEQVIFDGMARAGELQRQDARVLGAARRVQERSEYVALEVARAYVNYGLAERLTALAQENIGFHQAVAGRLERGVASRTVSETDLRQAEERLAAARRRLIEVQRDQAEAALAFERLVGAPILGYVDPPRLSAAAPESLDAAITLARRANPEVRIAQADIAAAEGQLTASRSGYLPRVSVEGRARTGQDIDAFSGETTDLQVRAVLRWTLFDSGGSQADVAEQAERVSEERFRLQSVGRQVAEEVGLAWDRLQRERELVSVLSDQAAFADDVVEGYAAQFNAGQRSLLDLLDAQNSRLSTRQLLVTSEHALIFAEYRLLAATGGLVDALGLDGPAAAAERAAAPVEEEREDRDGWLRRVIDRLTPGD